MLYLNSIENAEASPTKKKYAICHEEIPSMLHIPELAPSRELLTQWQSNTIDWEDFRQRFTDEMRAEYRKEESRLKGLIKYSLENDVTLHSPEPSGDQTYRAILEGIINVICKSQGQTGRVTNLASEPVEESPPQEDIASLFGNTLHELNLTKDDNTRLLRKNDELQRQIDQLREQVNTHETTIGDLRQTLSEKDQASRSLNDTISEKDRENSRLNRENRELDKQINVHAEDIRTKDDKIQLLQTRIRNKDKDIAQLQEISTHPKIRDTAVGATENNPVFEEHFRTLDIDTNLPVELRKWLEELLFSVVDPLGNIGFGNLDLNQAINQYHDFDRADNLLAHVIRTQGNLSVHENIDERTEMGRALCCFFAAALLAPKLSKSDHTTVEPLKSIQPKPNDAEVHYSYGIAYLKKGDYNRAIIEYTKTIELKPDYAGAYRNRGRSYYHKGDYASAIKDYTKAIELKPDSAIVYRNRGIAYYRKGDYASAIADLTQAIELKPDYTDAYNNRGHAYQKKGDRARAQADFDKAEQLRK